MGENFPLVPLDDPPLPYTHIVGLDSAKEALELAYIEPRLKGVLICGGPGVGKSLLVRSFTYMLYGRSPVTLPLHATSDRVIGGWEPYALARGELKEQPGLLEEADGQMLFVDDIHLLPDHLTSLLVDVALTGEVSAYREGQNTRVVTHFTLLGTACLPEEGRTSRQLLGCFGLCAIASTATDAEARSKILHTQLEFASIFSLPHGNPKRVSYERAVEEEGKKYRTQLTQAKDQLVNIQVDADLAAACVAVSDAFHLDRYWGSRSLLAGARASAARGGQVKAGREHLQRVVPFVVRQRRAWEGSLSGARWDEGDDLHLHAVLAR